MATKLQVKKLSFVTDIRETRLKRLLSEAMVALECATAELKTSEQWVERRLHELSQAAVDFARCPQNETVRIWHELCRQRLDTAKQSLESAKIDHEDALVQLATAQRDVRKIQERGKYVMSLARSLRKDEIRRAEVKADDEVAAKPATALLARTG
jgi:predicted secreted acid phosphatase